MGFGGGSGAFDEGFSGGDCEGLFGREWEGSSGGKGRAV